MTPEESKEVPESDDPVQVSCKYPPKVAPLHVFHGLLTCCVAQNTDLWVPVATGRCYTPLPSDVARALKLEAIPTLATPSTPGVTSHGAWCTARPILFTH